MSAPKLTPCSCFDAPVWQSRLGTRRQKLEGSSSPLAHDSVNNLVDPASSHMLVSKIKPCMSQYKLLYGETANGSLKQL